VTENGEWHRRLTEKFDQQIRSQRVGFLLGAGTSYLGGSGYPLASSLWEHIRSRIADPERRDEIEAKLEQSETKGLEHALDLLDDGGPMGGPHRHLVAEAIASYFATLDPPLEAHKTFVRRLAARSVPRLKIFSLNYDPLLERAAAQAKVRLHDGFIGHEHAFFEPVVFDERIVQIRGTHRGRQPDETAKPLQLLKLHGSLGWYDCPKLGTRRAAFGDDLPTETRRLMIPPQRRKAADTMGQPYAALWSAFRGALRQDTYPLNRLIAMGYGFADEHVNTLIESALARTDFSLLILTRELEDGVWERWNTKRNVMIVTEDRCALAGDCGPGGIDLWRFESLVERI